MTGQWSPTVPTTGRLGVAIATAMATTVQQTFVTATILLIVTAADGCRAALYIK